MLNWVINYNVSTLGGRGNSSRTPFFVHYIMLNFFFFLIVIILNTETIKEVLPYIYIYFIFVNLAYTCISF